MNDNLKTDNHDITKWTIYVIPLLSTLTDDMVITITKAFS